MQYNQYPGGQGQPPSGYNQYNGPAQSTPPAKTGRPALRWGLIFGIILAVVNDGGYLILNLVNSHSVSTSTDSSVASAAVGISLGISCLIFLIGLAAYFVAGILASRQTGLVRTGLFAGMWTGGIYGVVDVIVRLVVLFAITLPIEQAVISNTATTSAASARQLLLVFGIVEAVLALLLDVGVGAGLGSLGGLIGRSSARKRMPQAVYAEQMYQPYPGQPVPPMAPMNGPFQPPFAGPYPPYPQAPLNTPPANPAQAAAQPFQPAHLAHQQPGYVPQGYAPPPQNPQPPQTPPVTQNDQQASFANTNADSGTDSHNENNAASQEDATRPASASFAPGEEPTVRVDPSNYPRYPEQ